MFDGSLRPVKDGLLKLVVKPLIGRIHPNGLTLMAFALGLTSGAFLLVGSRWLALGFWIGNRTLDGMDGLLARASGTVSDRGAYLDIMTDFFVYALIPLAIAFGPGGKLLLAPALIMIASFYVNGASWMYLSALLEKRMDRASSASGQVPTSVAMPGGIVEGGETVLAYTLLIAMPQWRQEIMYLMAALTGLGAVLRTARGFAMLKQHGKGS